MTDSDEKKADSNEIIYDFEADSQKNALERLKLWSYTDFFALKPEKRYLIKDFLLPNTVNMLYSPPEQYKSLISIDLAMAITHGTDFLGLKTKKWAVLVLDKENNPHFLKDRLSTIHKGRNQHSKKYPLYYSMGEGSFDDPSYIEDLKRTIKAREIKLLIIDTLHRFSNYDENKADDLNRLYTTVFRPLVNEYDCAILFLHHTTKEGIYRGTADFMGMVDSAWSIRKHTKQDTHFTLKTEKSRFGSPIDKIMGEVERGEDYTVIRRLNDDIETLEAQKAISTYKECTYHIMFLFPIQGHKLKRSEILDYFETNQLKFANRTIRRGIEFLLREKYLVSEKKGYYTRIGDSEVQKNMERIVNRTINLDNQKEDKTVISKDGSQNKNNRPNNGPNNGPNNVDQKGIMGQFLGQWGPYRKAPLDQKWPIPEPAQEPQSQYSNILEEPVSPLPGSSVPLTGKEVRRFDGFGRCSNCGETKRLAWVSEKDRLAFCGDCDLPPGMVKEES